MPRSEVRTFKPVLLDEKGVEQIDRPTGTSILAGRERMCSLELTTQTAKVEFFSQLQECSTDGMVPEVIWSKTADLSGRILHALQHTTVVWSGHHFEALL